MVQNKCQIGWYSLKPELFEVNALLLWIRIKTCLSYNICDAMLEPISTESRKAGRLPHSLVEPPGWDKWRLASIYPSSWNKNSTQTPTLIPWKQWARMRRSRREAHVSWSRLNVFTPPSSPFIPSGWRVISVLKVLNQSKNKCSNCWSCIR